MIYTADFDEVKTIIKMALEIPEEHGFNNLPEVDLGKVSTFFYEKFKEAPILVYKEDGEIVGFIGLQLVDFWWSTEKMVNDYIFFVAKEHRNSDIANQLLCAMRDFAKLNKLQVVSNVISNSRTEAKQRLYKSCGYKHSGFTMTYGV